MNFHFKSYTIIKNKLQIKNLLLKKLPIIFTTANMSFVENKKAWKYLKRYFTYDKKLYENKYI